MPRTKVFLSCGQKEDSTSAPLDEIGITRDLKTRLENAGYEVYVSIDEHSVRGMVEDIFGSLEDSEYFLFVDFKREQLVSSNTTPLQRGSLFANQELALARFLDIKTLAYQEEGVKKEDGILKFLHLNPIQFQERRNLVDHIMAEVGQKWKPDWKNRLALRRNADEYGDARIPSGQVARWFHVNVENHHREKLAQDCLVYLEKVTNSADGDLTPGKLVEFKWLGVTTPRVTIPPGKSRDFDALFIFHDQLDKAYLGVNPFIVDSTELQYSLSLPGRYELTYVVFSNDFPAARETFVLSSDGSITGTSFFRKGDEPGADNASSPQEPAVSVVAIGTSGSTLIMQPGTLTPYSGISRLDQDL